MVEHTRQHGPMRPSERKIMPTASSAAKAHSMTMRLTAGMKQSPPTSATSGPASSRPRSRAGP
eukprot:9205880-Alexandrium_andersonii.AAC.1